MSESKINPKVQELADRYGYEPYYDMGGNGLLRDLDNAQFLISQITAENQDDYEIPTDPNGLMAWTIVFDDDNRIHGYAQGLQFTMDRCRVRYENANRRR